MDGWTRTGWRWIGMLCCLLAACGKQAPDAPYAPTLVAPAHLARLPEYTFGVTPMSNFRDIYDTFQPIVDYLNASLPDARLVLEVPRGLAEHEQQLEARNFAFALSNPYHSWRATQHSGYRIFAKMGDDAAFRGIWVVRKGSGITRLEDLKGKKVCFPPKSALAATMMTQLQLKQAGIDPARDLQVSYVGSQHASIMEVYMKGADAKRHLAAGLGRLPARASGRSQAARRALPHPIPGQPGHHRARRRAARPGAPGRAPAGRDARYGAGQGAAGHGAGDPLQEGRGRRIRRRAGLPRTTQAGLPGRTGCASLTG
ncbi:phosphate/phosphite/phosphonate ABC transporter substrate-binding protein [Massilia sp. B-10]|nr:phosphate/phosphite/phosphonate ABC transporter substrate-binding protein [Massilia sp. B-10]